MVYQFTIENYTNDKTSIKFLKFRNHMLSLDLGFLFDDNITYTKRYVLNMIQEKEFELFKRNWSQELNNLNRAKGGRCKLRSYRLFKSE